MKLPLLTLFVLCTAAFAALPNDGIRYEVRYGTDPASLDIVAETTNTEIILTNLEPETKYYFSVTAIQNGVESQPSALITYTTPSQEDVDEVQFSDDLINWKTEVYVPNRTGSKTRFVRIKPKVVTDKK
jgi:hypothetical protein